MSAINNYYDALAEDYDRCRFGNSYGLYIDKQEREILKQWLNGIAPTTIIDIGCGTGRFLDFAMTGIDGSAKMLKVAEKKFADRRLIQTNLPHLELLPDQYQAAICFHVFMHLPETVISQSIKSIAQKIPKGGCFIFDIPSKYRRESIKKNSDTTDWHGNTAANLQDINQWIGSDWQIRQRRGILFFPIHRIPNFMRAWLIKFDTFLGKTIMSRFSSYHIYLLERM